MNCPKDGHLLEWFSGDYPTGVVAPDGYAEQRNEEGFYCPHCGRIYDESDVSEEDAF